MGIGINKNLDANPSFHCLTLKQAMTGSQHFELAAVISATCVSL